MGRVPRGQKADLGGRRLASRTPAKTTAAQDPFGSKDQDFKTQTTVFKKRDMMGPQPIQQDLWGPEALDQI